MIIWLASYPKSGNTWLRFFIISLLMGRKTNLNLNHLKAIGAYPEKSQFKGLLSNVLDLDQVAKNWISSQNHINQQNDSLRFLKTHNIFGKFKNHPFTDGKNTLASIHIVRDPRNVITSIKNHFNIANYKDAKKFLFNKGQVLTLSENEKEKFMNREKHSLPQIIGSWKTHYLSWKSMKKNYLLIKYENLVSEPDKEFRKITKYLNDVMHIKIKEDKIDHAIKSNSFENLKKIENRDGFKEAIKDKGSGEVKRFFNLGPNNKWEKILDSEIKDEIEKKFNVEMKELGYL